MRLTPLQRSIVRQARRAKQRKAGQKAWSGRLTGGFLFYAALSAKSAGEATYDAAVRKVRHQTDTATAWLFKPKPLWQRALSPLAVAAAVARDRFVALPWLRMAVVSASTFIALNVVIGGINWALSRWESQWWYC